MNDEIPRINEKLLKNLNVISSINYQFGDKQPSFYNLFGKNKNTYAYGTHTSSYGWYYNTPKSVTIWLLKNGGSINGIVYRERHMRMVFDTNGPQKGPNKQGYDIFVWASTDWFYNRDWCSKIRTVVVDNMRGRGCYYYALRNLNPDDNSKNYWNNFLP